MADPTDTPSTAPADAAGAPGGRPRWRGPGGIAVVVAAAVLLVAGLLLALGAGDGDDAGGGTATTAGRSGPAASGVSGATGSAGTSGTTGAKGGKGGKGGKGDGTGSTTTTTPPATVETTPDGEADLARVRVVITPGTCLWNADTLDLTARGTIRNDNSVDAIVSIDVTFRDANGGEVDFASDLAILNPGEQASWDVLGASIDPPAGGLRCEVALS
ncbi:MAG: hypothetical protein ACKOZL_00405 [Actinomycetes bacterium]